jgi:hypothetical protein
VRLTKFREDLNAYIHSPGKVFTDETLPMVYRLPELYHYDLTFTEMKKQFVNVPVTMKAWPEKAVTLYPVQYTQRKVKKVPYHEYWLKNDTGNAFMILIDHANGLQSLWDREFKLPSVDINIKMSALGIFDELLFTKVTRFEIR